MTGITIMRNRRLIIYFYTDKRCFPRRISERRTQDLSGSTDLDRRIGERRSFRERRLYNKGAVYRRRPA